MSMQRTLSITYVDSTKANSFEFAPGSRWKILYEDSQTGQRAMLVEWDPRYGMGGIDHHEADEIVFVLKLKDMPEFAINGTYDKAFADAIEFYKDESKTIQTREISMAGRLAVTTGIPGLTHFWNVTQRVGGRQDCPNLPTDVELVKVLLKKALEDASLAGVVARVPSPQIVVNGQFDATVGYWIFRFQDHDGHPVIDGVASHAKGVQYQATSAWVIGLINVKAFKADPKFWRELPQNTTLSQQLRNELSK